MNHKQQHAARLCGSVSHALPVELQAVCLSYLQAEARMQKMEVCRTFKIASMRLSIQHLAFVAAEADRNCPYMCYASIEKTECRDILVVRCRSEDIFPVAKVYMQRFSRIGTVELCGFDAEQLAASLSVKQWGTVQSLVCKHCSSWFVHKLLKTIDPLIFRPKKLSLEGSNCHYSLLSNPIFGDVKDLNLNYTGVAFNEVLALCKTKTFDRLSLNCTHAMTSFAAVEFGFALAKSIHNLCKFNVSGDETINSIQKLVGVLETAVPNKRGLWKHPASALIWKGLGCSVGQPNRTAAFSVLSSLRFPGNASFFSFLLVQPHLQLGSGKEPLLELFQRCGGSQEMFESHMALPFSPLHAVCRGLSGNGTLTLSCVSEILHIVNEFFQYLHPLNFIQFRYV